MNYFFVNPEASKISYSLFPFKIASGGFKYLGVFFTNSFNNLFVKNFQPLVDKTKLDMSRWSSLPLSPLGRINLVKMVILPKFLYLFQHIPICIKKSFFTNLDGILRSFIWANKPARLKKSVLQLPKSKGGLALPNFQQYYWACNINKILYWNSSAQADDCPPWVHSEIASTKGTLYSAICFQLPLAISRISSNLVVTSTIKIWVQFRKHFGLHRASIHTPILNNHFFSPSYSDPAFRIWPINGLVELNDLYEDGVFASFSFLSTKYSLPSSHLFRFFQVRHFVKKLFPHFPNRPPECPLDHFLTLSAGQKHLISVIYNLISALNEDPTVSLRESWEHDLGISITDDQWGDILNLVHSSSICARHGLLQCKVLYRAHLTNAKLAKKFPDRSDACHRCKQSPANHLHMFWSCPQLTDFWSNVFDTLNNALNIDLDPNPLTVLFGISSRPDLTISSRQVIAFTTVLARRAILLKWKHVIPPSHDMWIREIFCCIKLEKLRFLLSGSLKSFHKTWKPFLDHIKGLPCSPDTSTITH